MTVPEHRPCGRSHTFERANEASGDIQNTDARGKPIARELSIDDVIGVEPEVAGGVLTGRLAHPNVRAEQKAIRLREWLGAPALGPIEDTTVHAYGNSSGDHELLALADRAWWLGRSSKCPDFARPFRPGTALC